jgi:hypothetical protein
MDSHPGASAVDVEDVELLFGAFWQRRLLRLQQFADREEDPERWMHTFLERYQAFQRGPAALRGGLSAAGSRKDAVLRGRDEHVRRLGSDYSAGAGVATG